MFVPEQQDSLAETYSLAFFKQHQAHLPAYQALSSLILSTIPSAAKQSFVDVGCGHGLLVECIRAHGIQQSHGVDGSSSARGMWRPEYADFYTISDLGKPEAANDIPKTSIVTSFETAEHIAPEHARTFVQNLTVHRPELIIFGAATPFQDLGRNPTHVNEQSFGYWIGQFHAAGYTVDLPTTVTMRNQMFANRTAFGRTWWYPKNLLVFFPTGTPDDQRLVRSRLDRQKIYWFESPPKNPVFNLVFERDKFEYLYLIEKHLRLVEQPPRSPAESQ